ncbi:hypothetical protein QIH13_27465, partial [Klebsiella pneumoniae]|nr:hypothetical protein [Klebsiella pneumoniae]
DDFTTKEQRPVFVTQGSLDEGFGVISKDLKDYIYKVLTTEESTEVPSNKGNRSNEEKILKELAESIRQKTSTKLFSKDDFYDFL